MLYALWSTICYAKYSSHEFTDKINEEKSDISYIKINIPLEYGI
jgi:hypothetical protein